MAIQTINPVDNQLVESFVEYTSHQVVKIIENAHSEFLNWREKSFSERRALMLNVANVLRSNKKKWAEIMTIEMGKPISQAIGEVEKCAWVCEYYAENAQSFLSEEIIQTDASKSYVRFDPIGIVLAVMPWNYPFWQVLRFAAPALMAGNVAILKHASNVPMSALAIEEVFKEAGFPKNVFSTLLIGSKQVENVIKNPFVRAVTLTGSEPAGKAIASSSGKVLKKTVMELGGSDPFIILKDANIEEAIEVGVTARILNNGQSCIAAKRFIMEEEIADEFETGFVQRIKKLVIGDPIDPKTELGPIAREDLLEELDWQVKETVKHGGKILTGGERVDREGAFYQPTVLSNVKKGMLAYSEELFGPVAIMIRAKNEAEAIDIANDTPFGLGASIWTEDIRKAEILTRQIDSGAVFINEMVKSDPRMPFGGIKTSGYGRELSHYGIKEFVNIKSVWVK